MAVIDLETAKDVDVKVQELIWWKHAQNCHKKSEKEIEGIGQTFYKNAVSLGDGFQSCLYCSPYLELIIELLCSLLSSQFYDRVVAWSQEHP